LIKLNLTTFSILSVEWENVNKMYILNIYNENNRVCDIQYFPETNLFQLSKSKKENNALIENGNFEFIPTENLLYRILEKIKEHENKRNVCPEIKRN